MKKLVIFPFLFLFLMIAIAFGQERRYLVFEFIKVESGQMFDYLEFKEFLEKTHQQAIVSGDIKGWDLWSLKSGSEGESFQYATITYYDDPVSMMNGLSSDKLLKNATRAFPEMREREVLDKIKNSVEKRDLAVRTYMVEIAKTNDNYQFKPGTLASFDLMRAVEGRFEEYEMAEKEVFLPIHEKKINSGFMESWCLLRTALPTGSEAKSTHMTMNVYANYVQFFNSMEFEDLESTEIQQMAIEKGLKSRDQKWVYLATLETVVR